MDHFLVYRARVACQDSGDCLSCQGYYSCRYARMTFPNSYEASLTCADQNSCESTTINCPSSETCNINCSGDSSCQYSFINCPQNSDCNIECTGQSSCSNARVVCPYGDYSCNIKCTNPLSQCGNLRILNTANVNLQCCGVLPCNGASILPSSFLLYNYELN